MSRDRDDDPLSWAGDDDPMLQTGADGASVKKPGAKKRAQRTAPASHTADPEQSGPGQSGSGQPSSAMLVVLGILGGIYLLYTVGWALNIGRDSYAVSSPIDQIMYTVGLWLAAIAAPLWFAASLWFTRGRIQTRVIWLVIGALVLIPWPFVIGGL